MDPADTVAAEPRALPEPEQSPALSPRIAPVPSPEVSPGLRNPVKVVKKLGFEAVTHGFRASFRDYAAERSGKENVNKAELVSRVAAETSTTGAAAEPVALMASTVPSFKVAKVPRDALGKEWERQRSAGWPFCRGASCTKPTHRRQLPRNSPALGIHGHTWVAYR